MNTETKTNLLEMARLTLDTPSMGTALAQAVIAAIAPPSRTPGRVWKAGEACPIVAEGQKRAMQDSAGPITYTVGESSNSGNSHRAIRADSNAFWLASDIATDLLAEDWTEQ